jgi:Uma2 family endonuclease
MATASIASAIQSHRTLAELLESLGGISAARVLLRPFPLVVPDLVIEVLSEGNTPKEMARKLDEYFRAGVRLVWYVNPKKRTVRVYTARDRSVLLREEDTLDGGDVLPGFALSIRDWFAEAERGGARSINPN